MRASSVLKRHSILTPAASRRSCQVAASLWRVSKSGTRLSRHWRLRTLNSISAMFSHEPCLGVWWISSFSERRLAFSGSKASYSEAGEWVLRLSITNTIRSACG
jgi:hypothetical protein